MKKILSLILAVLMVASCMTIGVFADTGVPHKKTGTVYTINGDSYYQAQTTSEYNGVSSGSEFWLDKNNNIITDDVVLKKLDRMKRFQEYCKISDFFQLFENIISVSNDLRDTYIDIVNHEKTCDIAGMIIGETVDIASKVVSGPVSWASIALDIMVDGALISSSDTATVAIIQMFKVYINNAIYYASEGLKYKDIAITDYDDMMYIVDCYAKSSASKSAAWEICGDEITEIGEMNWLEFSLSNFWEIFKSVGLSIFPGDTIGQIIASAATDGIIGFVDVVENLDVEKSYERVYAQNYNAFGFINADSSLVISNAAKLASISSSNSSTYSTGTYTPKHSDGCNIRSSTDASSSANIVGTVVYGNTFVVTKVSGAWGYTTYNNVSGWICLDYTDKATSSGTSSPTTDMSTFNSKLDEFKKKYPNNSTYKDNPGLTGGYQCFGFANELALKMFGSYPTNSMQATVVNGGWTRTYGGNAVDKLCVGDIVRYHMHSIFVTNIVGDTIYFCEALGDAGNRVRYDQTISKSTLKSYVSATLWHNDATTTGWVAHYNNGLSSTPSTTITYSDITGGVYNIYSGSSYLTAPTDTSSSSEGGDVFVSSANGQKTQMFEISKSGSAYVITARSSTDGKVLNIYRDGTAVSDDNVTLYKSTGDSTQLWRFEPKNGAYVIRSYNNPSLALTIKGSDINVSTCTYAANQLWYLDVPDDGRNWSDWSEWSATKVDANDGRNVQTKTVYRYYHYILMYPGGNCGAYPINADDFNRCVPGYSVTQKEHHDDIYSDTPLPRVSGLTYDKTYDCYENIHCPDDYSFSTNANYVYYLGTETWYRYRDLQYTVKFDANGGTGAPAAQVKNHNKALTLSATKPTRSGYNFKGWATSASGAVAYAPGASFNVNADTILYAVWEDATVAVTGVALDKTAATLTEGDTLTLTATVAPSNATNKNVTWSSSDASIAIVENGVVTAKKAGTATITVSTVDGSKIATCAVTVKAKTIAVTDVTLNKTSATLTEGDTLTLTATVAPSNAANKNVTWSSSDTAVATVSNGVVTAKKAGTATITVTTADGSKKATCTVTVKASYDPNALTFTVGTARAVTGKTVKIDISISNNPGIAGFSFKVGYDSSVMTLIGYECPGWEASASSFDDDETNNPVGFSWNRTKNYTSNTTILTLIFEIKTDAPAGDYALTLSTGDDVVVNQDKDEVKYNLVDGKITVVDCTPGDANGDGAINSKDAVLLAQKLAGWAVEIDGSASDCNGDGAVNSKDAVLLAQYLAGWAVTFG